ncbi:hypothetical protein [Zoogloea sp.]|uniref:hypothetical protein n=1 Tax=Zoogloea sp. TaxID=49181 RepID=UPI0035B29C8E
MDIDAFQPADLETVFRVLRSALGPADALRLAERLVLETYARIISDDLPGEDSPPMDLPLVHSDGEHQRDYCPPITLSLHEARARCGLVPKLPAIG